MIKLSGISKTFDNGIEAIRNVDLVVKRGEFLSLLGASGCGKSTVLRLIAGLLLPTGGSIEWITDKPQLGLVFQDATLMPWANALRNVRLPLDLARAPRRERDERAKHALARVGLSGFEAAFPRELSGGMRMRVSIARALVAKPEMLLMDEPFAALDEFTRQSLNDDLLKLWSEDNLTVVFVTHSVFESVYLSTRVAIMTPRPGRIAAEVCLSPARRDASYRLSQTFAGHARKISETLRGVMADTSGSPVIQ